VHVLKAVALLGGLSTILARAAAAQTAERDDSLGSQAPADEVSMADIPLSPTAKVTVERQGQIVLIGINRPYIYNRVDPETYAGLARAYYQFDHDPSLRAAVLFGHGDNFSRGIDVDAFAAIVTSGRPRTQKHAAIDPLAKAAPTLSKPLVVVVHGDTWGSSGAQDRSTHASRPRHRRRRARPKSAPAPAPGSALRSKPEFFRPAPRNRRANAVAAFQS
jgi:enoyl-CoA hydratase